jgi:hypothetical protein
MSSNALERWNGERSQKLDYMEEVHQSVGGSGPGRRYTTEQLNHLYAVALSAEFQGFCRDLHEECSDSWVAAIPNATIATETKKLLVSGRRLSAGNPSAGNIGNDFARLGIALWPQVRSRDRRATTWRDRLEELLGWRNAIAHQDFVGNNLSGIASLTLHRVRSWRKACNGLSRAFDLVMRDHLAAVLGLPPW